MTNEPFTSILTLPTWRQHQIPQVKGSVLNLLTQPHIRCQSQVQVVTCASDQPAIIQRFPRLPPFGFINLTEWLTELRAHTTHWSRVYVKRI